ncbi:MAG: hypothetical protein B6I38_10230 [Anaerolineaceae bacterium 4572_5.1]|nr:MAG: hypothetical protein B6I38_10230 [Anaerolineaceae bacterium 4572_5.1]
MFLSKQFTRVIQATLICFMLVACSSSIQQPTSTPLSVSPSFTPSLTQILPTTQKILPSSTPSLTQSLEPTRTPTLTPIPSITPTPLPTLPPEEARELVLTLMETNGGCKLPCWWGQIIPGKTRWEDAKAFLQSFASEIGFYGYDGDVSLYGVDFVVPKAVRYFELLEVSINVREGIVDKIFIGQTYPITDLLIDYGEPTEIWIYALDPGTTLLEGRFTVVLFWEKRGIMAVYSGAIETSNPFHICMDGLDPALWLWDSSITRTIEDVGGDLLFGSSPYHQREFYPLEDVTSIDISSFYQTYVVPENASQCFEVSDPDLP